MRVNGGFICNQGCDSILCYGGASVSVSLFATFRRRLILSKSGCSLNPAHSLLPYTSVTLHSNRTLSAPKTSQPPLTADSPLPLFDKIIICRWAPRSVPALYRYLADQWMSLCAARSSSDKTQDAPRWHLLVFFFCFISLYI